MRSRNYNNCCTGKIHGNHFDILTSFILHFKVQLLSFPNQVLPYLIGWQSARLMRWFVNITFLMTKIFNCSRLISLYFGNANDCGHPLLISGCIICSNYAVNNFSLRQNCYVQRFYNNNISFGNCCAKKYYKLPTVFLQTDLLYVCDMMNIIAHTL